MQVHLSKGHRDDVRGARWRQTHACMGGPAMAGQHVASQLESQLVSAGHLEAMQRLRSCMRALLGPVSFRANQNKMKNGLADGTQGSKAERDTPTTAATDWALAQVPGHMGVVMMPMQAAGTRACSPRTHGGGLLLGLRTQRFPASALPAPSCAAVWLELLAVCMEVSAQLPPCQPLAGQPGPCCMPWKHCSS